MYRLTLLFVTLFLLSSCTAQRRSGMSHFYSKYKADAHGEGIHVSRFLLQLSANDHESKALVKYIRSLNILHVEKVNNKTFTAMQADLADAFKADNYEDLLHISNDGDKIGLYVTEQGEQVNNVVLYVDNATEVTLIHLKTKMTLEQLGKLVAKVKSGDWKLAG